MQFGPLVVDARLFLPQSRPRVFVIAVDSEVDCSSFVHKEVPGTARGSPKPSERPTTRCLRAPESVRKAPFAVQRGVCPGCGIYLPHLLRFEVDRIVVLAYDGRTKERNLQLLCGYCNRVRGT